MLTPRKGDIGKEKRKGSADQHGILMTRQYCKETGKNSVSVKRIGTSELKEDSLDDKDIGRGFKLKGHKTQ